MDYVNELEELTEARADDAMSSEATSAVELVFKRLQQKFNVRGKPKVRGERGYVSGVLPYKPKVSDLLDYVFTAWQIDVLCEVKKDKSGAFWVRAKLVWQFRDGHNGHDLAEFFVRDGKIVHEAIGRL